MVYRTLRLTHSEAALSAESRRTFLRHMACAGMAAGLPPLLASCGGGGDGSSGTDERPSGIGASQRPTESRTLFFNFAHEDHVGKRYFYEAAGRSYELVPIAAKPEVLATARASNGFLRAVPNEKITHHVESVEVPTASVMLTYVGTDLDKAAGTWTMAGIYIQTSAGAVAPAHDQVVAQLAQRKHTLVSSAQRDYYGLAAANSATDLLEQSVLLDPPTHAATLVGLHPNLFALDPVASNVVMHGHLQQSFLVRRLSRSITELGAAQPGSAKPLNQTGWATLVPILDPTTQQPARITSGPDAGRLQCRALWHPTVVAIAGQAMSGLAASVKNDESLGADITSNQVSDGGRGKLWTRRDGDTSVVHSPGPAPAAAGAGPTMTLKSQTSQGGITVKTTSSNGGGQPIATITIENWYLRYLGAYLQFLDAANPPNVIALANIPEYAGDKIQVPARGTPNGANIIDSADTMYMGAVAPVSTVMGIPIEAEFALGTLTFAAALPQKATTMRVLCGGLGGGSVNYPQTLAVGAAMTATFNFGFTTLFAIAGAGNFLDDFQKTIAAAISDVVEQLAPLIVDSIDGDGPGTTQFWIDQGAQLAETLISKVVTGALEAIVAKAIAYFVTGTAEKAIPIVDVIMAALSAFIAAGEIIQSTVEIALSPWTYVNDLVYSYDLSVALSPTQGAFPAGADTCRVTAMFDDGTPHVQTFALTVGTAPPPVVFRGVPLGGNVNVSTSLNQSATRAGADDILLGKGSTGSQPNNGQAFKLMVEQIEFPIGPTTTYRHRQKTMVDDNDQHIWSTTSAPTTTATACGLEGTICSLRSITVRQRTATDTGYLGYSWQAQNADPSRAPSCKGGGAGQLDQVANLGTGTDPQQGYALSRCGFSDVGVRVAYSLLSDGSSNFFLDTNDPNAPVLRQVSLGTYPSIGRDGPQSAWGVLNLASDLLLLHPAGHAVSVNTANHVIETHRLPRTAVNDDVAKVSLIAEVKSGQGSRPGLIHTPVAAAITADGTLLILESENNRIQAMNLGANPVQHFTKQKLPYFLTLDATTPNNGWTHLDMAVEFTGFIYVLSKNSNTGAYQMNIYHPAQDGTKPIATATTMNAAKLTVDFWRNVYTLNYEVIQRANASNSRPPPVTEPSVSFWTPCNLGQTCPA